YLRQLFKAFFPPARRRNRRPSLARRANRTFRPWLEQLEDRLTPSVSSSFDPATGILGITFNGTNNDTITIQSQNTAANDFKVNAAAGPTLDGTAGNSETFTGVQSILVRGSNATGETVTFDTNSQNSVLGGGFNLTDIDVVSLTDSTGTGSLKARSFLENGGTSATTTIARPLPTPP